MALSVSTDHLLHLCLFLLPTLISCEYSETSILVSIKEQLGGDLVPALSSWNPRSSPCDGWAGIKCSGAGRFVTGISLRKAGISTPIPPSICNLKYLTSLDVAHNNFMPNLFPTFLNRCANLRHLDFSNNRLSGPLPQSLCSQLAEFEDEDDGIVYSTTARSLIPHLLFADYKFPRQLRVLTSMNLQIWALEKFKPKLG